MLAYHQIGSHKRIMRWLPPEAHGSRPAGLIAPGEESGVSRPGGGQTGIRTLIMLVMSQLRLPLHHPPTSGARFPLRAPVIYGKALTTNYLVFCAFAPLRRGELPQRG